MNTLSRFTVFISMLCAAANGNSLIYKPLTLPKAEDVVLFTNGLAPAPGERVYKKREDIMEFLRRGKNNLDVASWYKIEQARDSKNDRVEVCDGVFTDRAGRIYFWELKGCDLLTLRTAEHESALIQLKPK